MRFREIQISALSVIGSLSKVWLKSENAKTSDAPLLSLDEILSFFYFFKQVIRFRTIKGTTFC